MIRAGLQSIPDLIEDDLTRTAYSPLIYEYKDYAVGLVDPEGRSIALAQRGLPLFLTNLIGVAVRDGVATYGLDRIERGDVIMTNHAETIGQHLNNVVMYTPVFGESGRLCAFMAVIVHWIDIGGRYPGSSLGTDTTELVQEGLQLRSVRLYRRGERVEEMFRIIEYNTRVPEMLLGDIAAQHAGCIRGRQMFEALLRRHGETRLFAAVQAIWTNAEASARRALQQVPQGTYEMHSFLDGDGIEDKHIPVHIKVHITGDEFVVDYSDIGAQVRGPYNCGPNGGAETCARIAFKYLFSPDEPANQGSFVPVRVILPPGKFLSAAPGAPLGQYSTPLPSVVDTIIAAMAPVMPERVAAGHHSCFGIFGFSGEQPGSKRFFSFFDTALGGWGGSAHADGVGPYKTLTHADTKDIPVESIEASYPLIFERYAWRIDSAGAGMHRGGLGIEKTVRALAPMRSNVSFERGDCPPWGLNGGAPGDSGGVELERSTGEHQRTRKASAMVLAAGDRLRIRSPGGGGYGPPEMRDPESVATDVRRELVSRAAAEQTYRVALHDDGTIDRDGT